MQIILITALIFTMGLSAHIAAQNTPKCPQISVTGPAGLTDPGDPVTFILTIKNAAPKLKLTYKWTSTGEIVEGQGTTHIKVLPKDDGTNLTSTVEVDGLPIGCESAATETVPCCPTPSAELLFEFAERLTVENKASVQDRFDKENPYVSFYILMPGSKDYKSGYTKEAYNTLSSIFNDRGTFVFTEKDDISIKIYVVPLGAPNPQP